MKPETLAINVSVAVGLGAAVGALIGALVGDVAMGISFGPAVALGICLVAYGDRISRDTDDRTS